MKNIKNLALRFAPLWIAALLLASACSRDDDPTLDTFESVNNLPAEVALKWNELFLNLERFTPGYRPPVSARTSAYIGLAAYESVVGGMDGYNSMTAYFPGLVLPAPEAGQANHWPSELVAAYAKS